MANKKQRHYRRFGHDDIAATVHSPHVNFSPMLHIYHYHGLATGRHRAMIALIATSGQWPARGPVVAAAWPGYGPIAHGDAIPSPRLDHCPAIARISQWRDLIRAMGGTWPCHGRVMTGICLGGRAVE